jgi:hypothetical protein
MATPVFDPNQPFEDEVPVFDPNQPFEEETPAPTLDLETPIGVESPGVGEAAIRSFVEGLSAGTGDAVLGLMDVLSTGESSITQEGVFGMGDVDEGQLADLQARTTRARAIQESITAKGEAENPGVALTSEMAGFLLGPGKLIRGGKGIIGAGKAMLTSGLVGGGTAALQGNNVHQAALFSALLPPFLRGAPKLLPGRIAAVGRAAEKAGSKIPGVAPAAKKVAEAGKAVAGVGEKVRKATQTARFASEAATETSASIDETKKEQQRKQKEAKERRAKSPSKFKAE